MLTPNLFPVLRQSEDKQKRTLAMVAYFLAYSMKSDLLVDHVNLKEYGFYVNFGRCLFTFQAIIRSLISSKSTFFATFPSTF